jgi:deazaflavin-dependent oxidoreductase (nitroreductase family)
MGEQGQAGRDGQGIDAFSFSGAKAPQRLIRTFAASGPGSWMFARVLHHIDKPIHRMTGGRHTLASLLSGLPVVFLTTTGARSGKPRTVPVLGLPSSEGLVVIASNYGQERHPAWYYNLLAEPTGEVTVEGVTKRFRATIAEGAARDRIWQEGLRIYPGWSQYERRASHRKIAVFVLGDD